MAKRYRVIIAELAKLRIPDGVRQIVADYVHISDRERMIGLIKQYRGNLSFYGSDYKSGDDSPKLSIYANYWETHLIIVPGYRRYARGITVDNLILIINSRFWLKCRLNYLNRRIAPLWQKLYEMWRAQCDL